jgi:hypothetical protein
MRVFVGILVVAFVVSAGAVLDQLSPDFRAQRSSTASGRSER